MFYYVIDMSNITYLTKEWYEKLLEELKRLRDEELPAVLERLREAIEQWDISENAEYDTAMSEKELLNSRIWEIELSLQKVEIIEASSGGDIKYGSKVVILEVENDIKYEYTIVGSGESEILEHTISMESPLGSSMRWKKAWDTVTVRAPNKRYDIRILEVK